MSPAFWLKKLRKALLILGGLLVLVSIGGFLVAPPMIKARLNRQIPELLHRSASVGSVRVNPFALSVKVLGLEVKDRDGAAPFFGFDALYVRLDGFASLVAGTPVMAAVRLEGPRANIVRNQDGMYNFSDLLNGARTGSSADGPLHYSLNNIRITGGRVDFEDRPLSVRHEVTGLRIGIPFLSNLPSKVKIDTEPAFSALVDGRPIEIRGKARPFDEPPQMVLDVEIAGLDLPRYIAYLPFDLGVLVAAGTLDARGSLAFTEPREGGSTLVLSGRLTVSGLALEEKGGGPLARLPRIEAHVISADLLGGRYRLGYLRLLAPEVELSRRADGRWNFQDLLPASPSGSEPAGEPPVRLSVGEIAVADGTLSLDDQAVRPHFRMVFKSLEAKVTSFDSGMETPMGTSVRFVSDSGVTFKDDAVFTPGPLAAEGAVEAAGVQLGPLEPYLRPFIPVAIGKGTLGFSFRYALQFGTAGLSGTLSDLSGSVSGLSARLAGGTIPMLTADSATVKAGTLDFGRRTAQLGDLSFDGARLSMTRGADGSIDLASAFFPDATAGAAPGATPSWEVEVNRLAVARSVVQVEDLSPANPAHLLISLNRLEAEDLTTRSGAAGHIAFRASLDGAGTLDARGSLGLVPPILDWTVSATGLPLMPFEPYLSDFLEIQLTGGAVSSKGRLSMKVPDMGAVQASFEGDLDVTDLTTVDRAQMQDFLSWKSLHLGSVAAQSSPPRAAVKEVALSDFYSRLVVSPEGRLNLVQILSARDNAPEEAPATEPWDQPEPEEAQMSPEEAPAEPTAVAAGPGPAAVPLDLTIDSVSLAGGTIDFTDHFVKPNYSASMTEVAGRLSGLSSEPSSRAELEVRAKLDHQAPIEVTGTLNPLVQPLFLDIRGKATDIELSPMSPYSGRFAGYIIEKGKLNADVSYHVENGKLKANNHIFLDQFTFGDKVESADATKLPIRLAVALLKDRQGRIDLTLPVSGSLNDPKFKIGRVILRIFVNLISKAVTSPFALLGSLFGGGGETLSFVEFDPGRATLDAAAQAKVDLLGKALADRPGLRLEMAGRFDPEADREGLKKVQLEQRVKAEKLRNLLKGNAQPHSPDSVTVDPQEYPDLLFRAYKHMKFPKPRTLLGTAKELPVPEMEQLMLAHLPVTDDDLHQLAQARAQAVKDSLCRPGAVEAVRVFLAADTKPSAEAAKAKASRVDLTLK